MHAGLHTMVVCAVAMTLMAIHGCFDGTMSHAGVTLYSLLITLTVRRVVTASLAMPWEAALALWCVLVASPATALASVHCCVKVEPGPKPKPDRSCTVIHGFLL